jgi:hypothetical protein
MKVALWTEESENMLGFSFGIALTSYSGQVGE